MFSTVSWNIFIETDVHWLCVMKMFSYSSIYYAYDIFLIINLKWKYKLDYKLTEFKRTLRIKNISLFNLKVLKHGDLRCSV